MVDLPKKVGWIGLGIMGLPMVRNMLAKMKHDTQFYVYDVVQKSIDQLVQDGKGRVHACSSSKDVADHSVCRLRTRAINYTDCYTYRTSSSQWSPKEATCVPST
jgi:6-phosphogluconate dehydrogenase (decarboxylating)